MAPRLNEVAMLRATLRSASGLTSRAPAAAIGRQWQSASSSVSTRELGKRGYADSSKTTIRVPKLPTSETNTAAASPTPVAPEKSIPSTTAIRVDNVPLTPPAPPKVLSTPTSAKTASTSSPPPPPPPPVAPAPPPAAPPVKPHKGFFTRLRNYVLTLLVLGAISFVGGVWYSRISDRFHDFFTEYIPFGEQAVLYMQDLEYRKRAPTVARGTSTHSRDSGVVRMPAHSGASWRVADKGEPAGRTSSALDKAAGTATAVKEAVVSKAADVKAKVTPGDKETAEPVTAAKDSAKTAGAPTSEDNAKSSTPTLATPAENAKDSAASTPPSTDASSKAFRPPEVNEPSRFPPASPIDPLAIKDASEPMVQELVHMLNDVITVINADGAAEKYSGAIWKAKERLDAVGQNIKALKQQADKDAAAKVKARIDDFDKNATDLLTRVESVMAAQEAAWQKEFAEEMAIVKDAYEGRLKTMTEREKQINENKTNNKLAQQAIELKRLFSKEVTKSVEGERNGRLARLNSLSSAVTDLEKLATGWNDVVDTNLRTQQLNVALDAVRASLEDATHPRPFIKELVALKEIASDDTVVSAAIASINPSAYQRGIATAAELIDRFRRVAGEVRKASLLPDNAGVASHASSYVLSKVMFKKEGLVAGDDVESVLTRTQTLLEEGDLDGAAREMNELSGWAKTLSKDWMGEVRKVLEVQQALEVIQTEARLQSLKVE